MKNEEKMQQIAAIYATPKAMILPKITLKTTI